MKKVLMLLAAMTMAGAANAVELGEYIKATLLDNVVTSGIYGIRQEDRGPAKLALTDTIIRVGRYQNSSIVDLQAGFFGNANEVPEENQAVNWIFGAQLRLDPLVKSKVPLDHDWEFLKSVQFGPSVFYDATNSKWLPGFQVGLSFNLEPNQD